MKREDESLDAMAARHMAPCRHASAASFATSRLVASFGRKSVLFSERASKERGVHSRARERAPRRRGWGTTRGARAASGKADACVAQSTIARYGANRSVCALGESVAPGQPFVRGAAPEIVRGENLQELAGRARRRKRAPARVHARRRGAGGPHVVGEVRAGTGPRGKRTARAEPHGRRRADAALRAAVTRAPRSDSLRSGVEILFLEGTWRLFSVSATKTTVELFFACR